MTGERKRRLVTDAQDMNADEALEHLKDCEDQWYEFKMIFKGNLDESSFYGPQLGLKFVEAIGIKGNVEVAKVSLRKGVAVIQNGVHMDYEGPMTKFLGSFVGKTTLIIIGVSSFGLLLAAFS